MSSVRRSALGVRLMFAGRSVNGTMVSPCASAGIAQSVPSVSRPPAASPLFNVSRRLIFCDMLRILSPFLVAPAILLPVLADRRRSSLPSTTVFRLQCIREGGHMRSIGPMELVIILALAALMFGGKKIPELAKGLGEGIRNFKTALKNDEEKVEEKKQA